MIRKSRKMTGAQVVALLEALTGEAKLDSDALEEVTGALLLTAEERAKLAAIEAGAKDDQTGGEIVTLLEALTGAARLSVDAVQESDTTKLLTADERTKLAGLYGVPAGAVQWFAMTTPPTGWLECDGSEISRATYSALFFAISDVFGVGDGSTTFAIPDLRGEFIRGYDNSRGIDAGRAFGSAQADEFKSHTHPYFLSGSDGGNSTVPRSGGTYSWNPSVQATGGDETRPRNLALMACIKY